MEFHTLESIFNSHQYHQEFEFLPGHFRRVKEEKNIIELEAIYQQVIRRFENLIWLNKTPTAAELSVYQKLFREMEQVYASLEEDRRSHFVVVIPVADCPKQLRRCLQSLYTQCLLYQYGGSSDGMYNKLKVIIADDSLDSSNMTEHQRLSEEYTSLGMRCEYFGLEQQKEILSRLNDDQLRVVTEIAGVDFHQGAGHKGASAMRNFTYLRLAEIAAEIPDPLFFFVDSDYEFLAKVNDNGIDKNLPVINYLYHFDHLFREKQIRILTGRLTGAPPVSPTVMIGNFIEDVIAFLQRMVLSEPQQDCYFHDKSRESVNDEAYHDMPELYGHYPSRKSYDYHCPLQGEHTLEETLIQFSRELDTFFHGEHPTRMIFYDYDIVRNSAQPARTLYPGNWIFRPDALEYFIPFAPLKLKMAGPVLGRILQQELGHDFLVANTPLLYQPVIDIEESQNLAEEYKRQYFGDIMLLSVEKLLENNELTSRIDRKTIADVVYHTRNNIKIKYSKQQQAVLKSLRVLESLLRLTGVHSLDEDDDEENELAQCGQHFLEFVKTVRQNFSEYSANYALLNDGELQNEKCEQIISAIEHYAQEREDWRNIINKIQAN